MFGMIGGGSQQMTVLSYLLTGLVLAHVVIGFVLTGRTLKARRRAGRGYFKENRLFWIRRISGFALMLFIIVHMLQFMNISAGQGVRLQLFDGPALAGQLLLAVCLLVHLLSNITPLTLALGLSDRADTKTDVMIVLAVLLFLAGAGFIIYYLRWLV